MIIQIGTCAVILSAFSLIFRPDSSIFEFPLTEDGFYSLTVARNIAIGRGVTADGISLTNGFQPFFTLLCVPAYVLADGDRYLGLRFVLLLHWLFYLGTAYVLACIGRDALKTYRQDEAKLIFWIVMLLYVSSSMTFSNHFNGLETGCLLFLLSLAWRHYQIGPVEEWVGLAVMGVVLGLAVLARIDVVFLVIALSAYEFLKYFRKGWLVALGRSATVAGVAFLISLPWWLYNLMWFGSIMPSSGQAYLSWGFSLKRLEWATTAILKTTVPLHPALLGGVDDIIRGLLTIALIGSLYHYLPTNRLVGSGRLMTNALQFAGCFVVSLICLVMWYALSFDAYWFYTRYFGPTVLVSTLAVGYLFVRAPQTVRRLVAVAVGLLCFSMVSYVALIHLGKISSASSKSMLYHDQLGLVQSLVSDGNYVAAYNSGTLSYFRDHVVNLDGKVNSSVLKLRNSPDKLLAYLLAEKVHWFCDLSHKLLGDYPHEKGWHLVGTKGKVGLYQYVGKN